MAFFVVANYRIAFRHDFKELGYQTSRFCELKCAPEWNACCGIFMIYCRIFCFWISIPDKSTNQPESFAHTQFSVSQDVETKPQHLQPRSNLAAKKSTSNELFCFPARFSFFYLLFGFWLLHSFIMMGYVVLWNHQEKYSNTNKKLEGCNHRVFFCIFSTLFVGFYFQTLGVSPDCPIVAPRGRHNGGDERVPQRLERRRRRGQPAGHTAHPARRHRPVLRRCAFNRVASTSHSG